MTRYEEDFSEVFAEFDRLDRLPEFDHLGLDTRLEIMFQATQADVPVDTGHLKQSGEAYSRVVGDTWIGTISYGVVGDAGWEDDPRMSYAVFVLEEDDYMRATRDPLLTEGFRTAIADMLGGST